MIDSIKKQHILIILLISSTILLIGYYYFEDIIGPSMIVLTGIVAFLAIKVSRYYNGTTKFSVSYILLGLMFSCYTLGEMYYFVQGIWGIQTFLSFEEIFYSLFYVFGISYILQVLNFYEIKSSLRVRLFTISLAVSVFLAYIVIVPEINNELEFSLSTFDMALSSVFLAFTIHAMINLRYSERFREWVLISIAVTIYTLADLQYYITENIGSFSYSDSSNYGWVILPLVFIYILLRLVKNPLKPI